MQVVRSVSSDNDHGKRGEDFDKHSVIRFAFCSSYLGCTEYEVCGDGPMYRIEIRSEASDYERSIYNGSAEEWQRDCVAAVGLMHRHCENWIPLDPQVVAAFNDWRRTRHAEFVCQLRAQPQRYGEIEDNDPLLVPPTEVRGAHYEVGRGWVIALT